MRQLCLLDVSVQRGCFHAHRACAPVPAGDILAFHPGQLGGHLVQLMAQRADQLHGLGGIAVPHEEMVAPHRPSRRRTFNTSQINKLPHGAQIAFG
jgi:hypothetical protein